MKLLERFVEFLWRVIQGRFYFEATRGGTFRKGDIWCIKVTKRSASYWEIKSLTHERIGLYAFNLGETYTRHRDFLSGVEPNCQQIISVETGKTPVTLLLTNGWLETVALRFDGKRWNKVDLSAFEEFNLLQHRLQIKFAGSEQTCIDLSQQQGDRTLSHLLLLMARRTHPLILQMQLLLDQSHALLTRHSEVCNCRSKDVGDSCANVSLAKEMFLVLTNELAKLKLNYA